MKKEAPQEAVTSPQEAEVPQEAVTSPQEAVTSPQEAKVLRETKAFQNKQPPTMHEIFIEASTPFEMNLPFSDFDELISIKITFKDYFNENYPQDEKDSLLVKKNLHSLVMTAKRMKMDLSSRLPRCKMVVALIQTIQKKMELPDHPLFYLEPSDSSANNSMTTPQTAESDILQENTATAQNPKTGKQKKSVSFTDINTVCIIPENDSDIPENDSDDYLYS